MRLLCNLHKAQPVSALQTEYSLFERGVENALLPAVRELCIGFVPYSPLGRGFLTGAAKCAEELPVDDWRAKNDPRLQGGNFDDNAKLADFVRQVGREKGATPSQIALAWLLHQGEDIVPIPGTKRRKYLEENLGAASMKLSPEELQKIASFLHSHTIAGQRYAASDLARVNG